MEEGSVTTQRFTATIEKVGSRIILPLPFDPNAVWGAKERHHITGSVNQHPIRGPLAREGEGYCLVLGEAWRRETGLDAGDTVEVTLSPEGPQLETMPEDLAAALDAEPEARAFFESIATFYRKKYLRWIEGARKPDIRASRITELVDLLKGGKKQR